MTLTSRIQTSQVVVRYESDPFKLLRDRESLVVDGSNLVGRRCTHHGEAKCNNPSPIWGLLQLLEQKKEWKKTAAQNSECIVVIDASLRHHVDDPVTLEGLVHQQLVVQAPPKTDGDSLILKLADERNAVVLSNDIRMRQAAVNSYAWLSDDQRFLEFTVVSDDSKEIQYTRRTPLSGESGMPPPPSSIPQATPVPVAAFSGLGVNEFQTPSSEEIFGRDLYQAEVSRRNPSCFIFLVDESGSMIDPFGGVYTGDLTQPRKADGVADALNHMLWNLILRCTRGQPPEVYGWYFLGTIGYGGAVRIGFRGFEGQELVMIRDLANRPLRVEQRMKKQLDGAGGLIDMPQAIKVWFESVATGDTPMCEALRVAGDICRNWAGAHPSSYPPTIINITDGMATDGEASDCIAAADRIKSIMTQDGPPLLFNIHISSIRANPIEFPDSEQMLPDEYARTLFRMSSLLTPHIRNEAQERYKVSDRSRGFVFNGDMVSLIEFLDMGTRPSRVG
jgi:hypothetical protein